MVTLLAMVLALQAPSEPRKVVLIAGPITGHPRHTHEYEKSVILLKHLLAGRPDLRVEAHFGGWPADPATLDDADTIVMLSDGADRKQTDHPLYVGHRLAQLERQMRRGCGLLQFHWSVFNPSAHHDEITEWIGGYFDYETGTAANKWYSAITTKEYDVTLTDHPIARGVRPFRVKEEFYYKMRFRENDARVVPVAVVGPQKDKEATVGWAVQRADGGRGFGFTGGHFFENWWNEDFRRLILNAVVWTAGLDVPAGGISSTLEPRFRALILTGHHSPHHDWNAVTAALVGVLEQDPRAIVEVSEKIEDLAEARADLLVLNYNNWEKPGLSDAAKAGLLRHVREGGGLAIVHFANGAFNPTLPNKESDWPEFRARLCRRVWMHDRSGHDAYGPFRVEMARHPVVEGLAPFDTTDELYFKQEGDAPIAVAATARSKQTGQDEPMAWTADEGKGRIFQTVLGHDAAAIRAAGALIRRGSTWAAGRPALAWDPPASITQGMLFREGSPWKPKAAPVGGRFGRALNGAAHVPAVAAYGEAPLSVECWTRLRGKTGFNILVAHEPKESATHWEIYSYAGTGAFSAYFPGMTPSEIKSDAAIADDRWHHVAMTFDGVVVKLFVDGKPVKEQAVAKKPGLKPKAGLLSVGMAVAGDHTIGCEGAVDEVRLSRALLDYGALPDKAPEVESATIGLWRFDEESGDKHEDASKLKRALEKKDPKAFSAAGAGDQSRAQLLTDWTPGLYPLKEAPPWARETDDDWIDARFRRMDTGPFLAAAVEFQPGGRTPRGLAVKAGDRGTWLFDRGTLLMRAAWTGGFLEHSTRRFGLINNPVPVGTILYSLRSQSGWVGADRPRYDGLYVHGKRTVLASTVGGTRVLEEPSSEKVGDLTLMTRTLEIAPSDKPLKLVALDGPGHQELTFDKTAVMLLSGGDNLFVCALGNAELSVDGGRIEATVAPGARPRLVKLAYYRGPPADATPLMVLGRTNLAGPRPLSPLTRGGPARYPEALITAGERGAGPIAVDTLTLPYKNPHRALFFVTGVDFLPDGRIAICTAHGDVWTCTGPLEKLEWRRFATGLFQPLGLRVVNGTIHVIERGQITKLHDLNADGEADFYENFCNDWELSGDGHAYNACLQVDSQGRFTFFKSGAFQTRVGGTLMRAAKDGRSVEVLATGFRHPIGMGMGPGDLLTGADQQGNWVPASRIDRYRAGGFYGNMNSHHRAEPPKEYEAPICWLPPTEDNSSGGQVWVPGGPLAGRMLHLSWGQCRLFLTLFEEIDGKMQGGVVRLPARFLAGPITGTFNPADGHLYVAGLDGWQTAAQADGCLQRVRIASVPPMPLELKVRTDGLRLTFSEPLADAGRWTVERWNYRWSGEYGSKEYTVADPSKIGREPAAIESATLSPDGRSVFLKIPDLRPVMQVKTAYTLKTAAGAAVEGAIHHTIHAMGKESGP